MARSTDAASGPHEQALVLAAGVADVVLSGVGAAAGTVRGFLRRADHAELAQDARRDLAARGRLALDKYAALPPAHLEILARQALARRADGGGD
ncbi:MULTISPECIES: polyprenyl synthetase [Streptomyces]|uniref:polyprenyl synthetase n=1 Tax=Streptomyces TaxID=1883 RepID=UPI00224938DD|nr:polyprenyl synthetase [Streptomyces sp. JHD 1]MCX2968990.1 polyprenyl synthetase [Streptomyces sp. JHD 1]